MPDLGTEEFFNFMNPGIRGVPVYGFMVLITAFAVLIGPVNYFYLSSKRLLWLLLVTVPATALVTSVLLVGYSVAAHGFSVRSRIRSLTVLDQKSQQAVTVARLALFAGVAPLRGMQFSPETAVYPVFPPTAEPGAFTVDWTETQALTSGWLLSRTRTQFLTIRHAERAQARRDQARTRWGPARSLTACLGSWRPCSWPTSRAGFCRRGMFCPTRPSRSPKLRRKIGRTLSGSWAGTVLSFPTISARPFSIR